ncbi:MAG: TRAP transporter fused permease subunit [Trueperaceae bacterium]
MTTRQIPNYSRVTAVLIALVGVSLSLFQLYTAGVRPLSLFYQRPLHLMLILLLTFLMFPMGKERRWLGWLVDLIFMAGALVAGLYLTINLDAVLGRAGFWTTTDVVVGGIAIVTLLEGSRRALGWTITMIGVVFFLYATAGPRGALPWLSEALPGILGHRGYTLDRILAQLYLGQEGIYGTALGVAATFVYIFILFGAILEITGAGKFFIDLAYSLTGRQRGGPAKAAVLASGFMGSISGSAIANTVTSGAFTIPLMKKLGYKPEEAGGVEAAASTGGQIMPPVMGAGAFLIAEFTRIPYIDIVKMSILPAILYFSTVYLFVDIIAAKRGMKGMRGSELPRIGDVFRDGWHFLVPLLVLVYFLLLNISPARVGFIAILSILAVAVLRWLIHRLFLRPAGPSGEPVSGWRQIGGAGGLKLIAALEAGARNAVPVSLACAVAGIVVGVVGLTGLGLKFSSLMLSFSGGNLLLALLMVIIASLILGMGLPVTASYIVLVILTAPALTQEFGIPLIIAHLVVFWYSQDSNVTPPVALAAYAGAGIAGADPMRTSFQAWKFAKGLYLIPLFMVYNPEIITGGPLPIVIWTVVTAIAALGAFAAALEGFIFTHMYLASRFLAAVGTVAIFWPDLRLEVAGFSLILLVLGVNYFKLRRERRTESENSAPRGAAELRE